ncbi:hypothetical protein J26TS2_29180 [Shouchella clausii]|nr:hypothetical protein J26TS2_29180 [Shouchella clausii]
MLSIRFSGSLEEKDVKKCNRNYELFLLEQLYIQGTNATSKQTQTPVLASIRNEVIIAKTVPA